MDNLQFFEKMFDNEDDYYMVSGKTMNDMIIQLKFLRDENDKLKEELLDCQDILNDTDIVEIVQNVETSIRSENIKPFPDYF